MQAGIVRICEDDSNNYFVIHAPSQLPPWPKSHGGLVRHRRPRPSEWPVSEHMMMAGVEGFASLVKFKGLSEVSCELS